ncbi:hypothetical protein KKF91_14570 [Myxococcota bacterium]|nr:hypothetical protein [Myxococcota bacterium]MBU1431765.1 hypothetical protein [Myxococcota bacterium]MBU1897460.1 hypothetical protein [Myxococcota bacterium]
MPSTITEAIWGAETILLTAPPPLDTDAIGAIAALALAIQRRWPRKRLFARVTEDISAAFLSLPRPLPIEHTPSLPIEALDLAIVLDGTPERLGPLAPLFEGARRKAQIDHHRTPSSLPLDAALRDPKAASTTLLILELCDHWGVALDIELATCIHAGLLVDTGGFLYHLTDPRALRAAARLLEAGIDHPEIAARLLLEQSPERARLRGAVLSNTLWLFGGAVACAIIDHDTAPGLTGGVVDELVFIQGVEVGALILKKGKSAKISLRSRGRVDVSAVAQRLAPSGGGHARASGAALPCAPLEALARLEAALAVEFP